MQEAKVSIRPPGTNWTGLLVDAMEATFLSEVLLTASSLAICEGAATSSSALAEEEASPERSFLEMELALAGFSIPSRLAKVFVASLDG